MLVGLIGLCVGSFLNVLADRLPTGESVLWGRSHCDYCKKTLRWHELIPVISYIALRGRCQRCHKPLSLRYPLSEIVTAIAFVWLYLFFRSSPVQLFSYVLIFSSFFVLFIADFNYQILPDSMIVAGGIGALTLLLSPAARTGIPSHLVAAAGSFAFLYIIWAATRGKGLGFGDVKFAVLMGLLLGYPGIIFAFYIAFLTGAAVGVILILAGKKGWKSKIAFGPFLILGTAIALVWGSEIMAWWAHML